MKTTRRIITIALTLALILALAIPALAATEGGSLVVERPAGVTGTGTTYKVYMMFDIDAANGSEKNTYKMTEAWKDFVPVETEENKNTGINQYIQVKDGYVLWKKNTTSTADAAAIAQLARAYVDSKALGEVGTVTAGGAALPLNADGYYLLVPQAPQDKTASGVVVVARGEEKKVMEKTVAPGMPTVLKQVREDTTGVLGSSNTAEIGEIFEYQITITAGQGASHYILHDVLDDHIELVEAKEIKRDGNPVPASDYTAYVATNPAHHGHLCKDAGGNVVCDFHIAFSESFCAGLADDATITIVYTAKLTEEAGEETAINHSNTAYLTHTEQNVPTDKSVVNTQTYKIQATKWDETNNKALAGAGFVLKDNLNKYYHWSDPDGNDAVGKIEWRDTWTEEDIVYSDVNGLVEFVGLDAENFFLEEVKVPGGYTGAEITAVSTKNGDVTVAEENIKIMNVLGTALPETGGIGTTVFYVAGIVLVLGALATLVIIKRKETSAQ